MVTPLAYFDLIESFPQPGCAVCRLLRRDVDHFLDLLLYERVLEPDTHKEIRASRGLCNEHGWQLTQVRGGVLGIATLYLAAVSEVLKSVEQSGRSVAGRLRARGEKPGAAVADSVAPVGECMACHVLTKTELAYVKLLAHKITDDKLQTAFRESDGLCVPHFQQVARTIHNGDDVRTFVAIQTACWRRLQANLNEFIDKYRAERSQEIMGAEADSGTRAIELMRGFKGVFGLDAHSRKR